MSHTPIADGESGLVARGKINDIGSDLTAHTDASGSNVHDLGTISTQSASAVVITGIFTGTLDGSISGSSVVTGSALDAHIALTGTNVHGLGTISTQNGSTVNITGGTISGVSGSDLSGSGIFSGTFTGELIGSISGSSVVTGSALDTHIALTGANVHGLGTISTQNGSTVNITGGTISGVSGSNLSGSGTFNGTFTGELIGSISGSSVVTGSALDGHIVLTGTSVHGLGTMSTQNASNVAITGGTISGVSITNTIPVTSASADITLGASHCVVLVSGSPVTVSLPTAVGVSGRIYYIKNTSSSTVDVTASGSQTIDGSSIAIISSLYSCLEIVSDGSNWNII